MAISGEMVRVTNISDEHIGLSRPSGAFLRRKGHKPADLTWSKFPKEWVDKQMLALEEKGRLRIQNVDEDGNVIKAQDEKVVEDPKDPPPPPADEPDEDEADEADEAKGGEETLVEEEETVVEDKETAPEVKVEEKVKPAADSAVVNLTPEPKDATVPTVSSSLDGKPVTANAPSEPEGDAAPTVTEESETDESESDPVKYDRSGLKKLNLRELREVLEDREINIDSTRKDPIIEAILDHQNLGA